MIKAAGATFAQRTWVPVFIRYGFLPLVMVAMLAAFGAVEPRFVGTSNLINLLEQSSFLIDRLVERS